MNIQDYRKIYDDLDIWEKSKVWTDYMTTMIYLNAFIDETKVTKHRIKGLDDFIDSGQCFDWFWKKYDSYE